MAKSGSKTKDIKPVRVWVTEFAASRVEAAAPFAQLPASGRQVVDAGAGPVSTAPLGQYARYVRVVSLDDAVIMSVGALAGEPPEEGEPVGLDDLPGDGILLPRGHVEPFGVEPGMVLSFVLAPV